MVLNPPSAASGTKSWKSRQRRNGIICLQERSSVNLFVSGQCSRRQRSSTKANVYLNAALELFELEIEDRSAILSVDGDGGDARGNHGDASGTDDGA